MKVNKPTAHAIDLFCGVGGLTYGLGKAGIKVTAGLDNDGSCHYAYEKNCIAKFIEADIRNISFLDLAEYFEDARYRILLGCAPCPPFSSYTWKSKPTDPRRGLINEFLKLILQGRPEIVLMENVPPLRNKSIYQNFKRKLADAGYQISDGILSCADFWVPQRRRRLIMLASLLGRIDLPAPTHKKPKTVRQAIGSLEPLKNGQSSTTDPLHICSELWPINLKRIRASKPGGSWRDWPTALLPDCYKKESALGYRDVYGRIKWDDIAPTITTRFCNYGSGRYGHPEQDRALSLREGAILQSFPAQYQFVAPGEKVSLMRIGRYIGNAVPPALAFAIGNSILQHLRARDSGGVELW